MPTDGPVKLVLVSRSRAAEFRAMIDEWKADGPNSAYGSIHAIALSDIDGYFALTDDLREGRGPIPNLVPSDTFWIEADGSLAGAVNVR